MNTLTRALIEKAGYANGWENVRISSPELVSMFSARHRAEAYVTELPNGDWHVVFPKGPPSAELLQTLPGLPSLENGFVIRGDGALSSLLRRAARLAMSLPDQVADVYVEKVAELEKNPLSTTEVLRLTKQRVGQDLFRRALMEYWGGACAVTGIAVSELLRASHAKPWADCISDAERLNVFNGFLLCAHLDALFDRGLLTFTDEGLGILSERITPDVRVSLNLTPQIRLRWCSPKHVPFIRWHRQSIANHHSPPRLGALFLE